MKIQNEQLQALQQATEPKKARKPSAAGGFDALLAEELGATGATDQAAYGRAASAVTSLPGLEGIAQTEAVPAVSDEGALLVATAQSIESMLSGLDEYAKTLASPQGADLRKAFGILQGLDSELAALREQTPDLASRHEGMDSLLNEISVITRVETVKMNRGDYI